MINSYFFRYIVFGSTAVGLDLAILYIFTDIFGLWYFFSSIISSLIATGAHFTLNLFFNFGSQRNRYVQRLATFYGVTLLALVLNQGGIYVLVEFFGMHYLLARILCLAVFFIISFLLHKSFTYREITSSQ